MRRLDPEEAGRHMIEVRRLWPLGPYPGVDNKWLCECMVCGNRIEPRFRHKGPMGCINCKYAADAKRRRLDPRVTTGNMLDKGYMPTSPYTEAHVPWPSIHLACGSAVSPSYSNIMNGWGGCDTCANAARSAWHLADPGAAEEELRSYRWTPLVGYPGAQERWKARHEVCGEVSYPRLLDLRKCAKRENAPKGLGCGHCTEKGGFKKQRPGYVYVIFHPALQAVKVGIRNEHTGRVVLHRRHGWKLLDEIHFAYGGDAQDAERAVLNYMRCVLKLPPFLTAWEMPQSGHRETADRSRLNETTLWKLVQAEAARIRSETGPSPVVPAPRSPMCTEDSQAGNHQ
ncbi:hypothetical protein ACWFR1_39945 [Streptomyces sp. NPDC055103]